jgi:hypothetical protein
MPARTSKRTKPLQKTRPRIDAPAGSEENYYGAIVRDAKTGPRRELTLQIVTWPKGKVTFGSGDVVTLRFGAIINYEEVQRFFTKVRNDGLHYLRELRESSPQRHIIEMEFDRTADRIRIIAGKVSGLVGK